MFKKIFALIALSLLATQSLAAYRAIGAINTAASGGTSITPAAPASVSSADDLIMLFVSDSATDPSPVWPSGFTSLGSSHHAPGAAGNTWLAAARKPAGTALPGSYAVTHSLTGRTMAVLVAWSGRAASAATVSTSNSAGTGTSGHTVTLTGLTAVAGDDLVWLACSSTNAATLSFATPSTFTEVADQANSNDTLNIAYKDGVSAGATGNVTTTITGGSGSDESGILVALPVSGGGSTAVPVFMQHYNSMKH